MDTRTVHELAAEIAPTLGEGWRVGPAHDADISAHVEAWRTPARQRLILTARAPFDLAAHTDRACLPQITVSRSKPARLIAHDIHRRLLPGYCGELHAAYARCQEHQAQQTARDTVVADLVETLNARVIDADDGHVRFGNADGCATGDVRVTVADRPAHVSLHVTPDAVLPLARALGALNTDSGRSPE